VLNTAEHALEPPVTFLGILSLHLEKLELRELGWFANYDLKKEFSSALNLGMTASPKLPLT
jgi:hypothetical protein